MAVDGPTIAFSFIEGGVNTALDPATLAPSQVSLMINGQIDRQMATTRPGARFVALEGEDAWRDQTFQGAIYYDPAKGQGAQVFSEGSASFIVAAGGRKFRIFIKPVGGVVEEITGENVQSTSSSLIWMTQAENYLIAGDSQGSTFIYDGESSFFSVGFNGVDREESRVPQGIRTPVYAYGRLWVVVDSRRILASDSLHGENQTNAQDLLKFIEQGYWATGQYFVPPSSMGNVIAGAILPTRDTRTGQGEIMWHCVNGGVFSIDGNVYPRDAWANTPMVKHFLLDTAAAGPYALDLQEGDQLFRSRSGVQTLRSAAAESRLVGRPNKPISEEVGRWLDADYVPYLRFASLINYSQEERLLLTTGPIVCGRHRFHKGILSLNWDVLDSGQAQPAWEGLWTFPKEYRYVAQLMRGMFLDRERVFGVHYNGEKYSLVEYDKALTADVLEDGTEKPIEMVVETRAVNTELYFEEVQVVSGALYLRDIKRTTDWEVYARNHKDECWTFWRKGTVCLDNCIDECSLVAQQVRHEEIELGDPGEKLGPGRRHQFRVVVKGWCRIEGLVVRSEKVSQDDEFRTERLTLDCKDKKVCCVSDYSYSES